MHRPRRCLIGKQRAEQFGTAMDPEPLVDDPAMGDGRVPAETEPLGDALV